MIRRFARPYAKAVMEVAQSPEKAQTIRTELARFEQARAGSNELAQLMSNPAIDAAVKGEIVAQIAGRLELSDVTRKILDVLVKNHRINDLGAISEALRAMVDQALGIAVAQVRSAHELGEGEKKKLQSAFELKLGQKVELEVTTDPTLLGGFVATIGSDVYDASVTGRIQKIRATLS